MYPKQKTSLLKTLQKRQKGLKRKFKEIRKFTSTTEGVARIFAVGLLANDDSGTLTIGNCD
jgi:hypothetical protein